MPLPSWNASSQQGDKPFSTPETRNRGVIFAP